MGMLFHDNVFMNFLVSPICFFGLSALWVLGVFVLVNKMMTHNPVSTKSFMKAYNVAQIALCGYMVWGLAPCLGFPNIFGISTDFDQRGEWFVFVHYLSKYFDWCDTLWIILNKKRSQLSFLHVFHHGTIVAVWGMLLHSGVGSGGVRYGAWINSLTHVIMYSHYFWTSMGLKNPFKKYITLWQISQFYSCFAHAIATLLFDTTRVHEFAWIQVLYQICMVYLFSTQMSWVPTCVPDFTGNKDDEPVSCAQFCTGNPQDAEDDTDSPTTAQKQTGSAAVTAWKQRYVVIRGEAYDISNFQHPGGLHMVDLAVGRDATIMFESAHLRLEFAEKTLATLPKCSIEEAEKKGCTFGPKETFPTPSQSELYETIRKRVVKEVLKPRGLAGANVRLRGVPAWHYCTVILSWLLAAAWFLYSPSILSGVVLGWTLAWIGTGVQHTANHGGLTKNTKIGYILGLLDDIAVGGSSIVWRYHHQVSHHAYCNDVELDQDCHSSFPVIRLDSSQAWKPFHRFQSVYAPVLFCFLWISTQFQDLSMLLDARSFLVKFHGTPSTEIVFGVLLKVIHFWWLVVLPYQIHGLDTMLFPWMACFGFGGFALSSMFIVSHNVDATKMMESSAVKSDWARQQIETSTSWGGEIGSFMSGGLNLQIEHHLFPCMAHHLYAPTQVVVKEECAKRGIHYNGYGYLYPNFVDFLKFLHHMGKKPETVAASGKTIGKKVD